MNDRTDEPSVARRLFRYTWVFGVALLVVSVTGTSWILRTPAADKPAPGNSPPVGGVVCFGHGDVHGGVRQLYPMLIQPNNIKDVRVRENDRVEEGAVLLEMDDLLARTNLQRAEADLKSAEVLRDQAKKSVKKHELDIQGQELAISTIQHRLATARRRLDRVKKARADKLLGEDDLEVVEEAVKSLQDMENAEKIKLDALKLQDPNEDITRAEQSVKEKQATRDQAEYALKQCHLTAPVAGTIVRLNVSAGDLLGPQPRQPAILFCPSTPRIIRAEIEQEFAGRVEVGDVASIQDDTITGREPWKGKVVRLSDVYSSRRSIVTDVPFQLNDVRTLECIIELDSDQKQPVKINQRMRVTLTKP
jgi:multidrug resistance efflux pump